MDATENSQEPSRPTAREAAAFDRWLGASLRREYAQVVLEPVPDELLRLLDDAAFRTDPGSSHAGQGGSTQRPERGATQASS
jgi:hypothetical protein